MALFKCGFRSQMQLDFSMIWVWFHSTTNLIQP